jgi:hypothetical protein
VRLLRAFQTVLAFFFFPTILMYVAAARLHAPLRHQGVFGKPGVVAFTEAAKGRRDSRRGRQHALTTEDLG